MTPIRLQALVATRLQALVATRLKALVALAMMLLALIAAQAWRPSVRLADRHAPVDLAQWFPAEFGGWAIDTEMPLQLVSPEAQVGLDAVYHQTLGRIYRNPQGQRIMLSVAYGGDQSDATRAHRPEVCYPAQGFEIVERHDGEIALGALGAIAALGPSELPIRRLRVRQLLTRQGGRVEPVTYWITVGQHVTLSGTEQKLAQLSYSLRGVIPDGMLVRVSSIDSDAAHAYRIQAAFVSAMVQAMAADRQSRVIGLPAV